MKAEELRLGNLLSWKSYANSGVGVVEFINNRDKGIFMKTFQLDSGATSEACEPIPLTEEWLLKLGFFKDNRNGWRLDDMYSLSFSITNEGEFYPCWQDRVLSKVITKYVHQVQNLYFALTGNELSVGTK